MTFRLRRAALRRIDPGRTHRILPAPIVMGRVQLMNSLPRVATLACLITAFISPARADDYPTRPVKVIVPFGAGGPTDVYTRDIAAELQQSLHQAFVMENRPG